MIANYKVTSNLHEDDWVFLGVEVKNKGVEGVGSVGGVCELGTKVIGWEASANAIGRA